MIFSFLNRKPLCIELIENPLDTQKKKDVREVAYLNIDIRKIKTISITREAKYDYSCFDWNTNEFDNDYWYRELRIDDRVFVLVSKDLLEIEDCPLLQYLLNSKIRKSLSTKEWLAKYNDSFLFRLKSKFNTLRLKKWTHFLQ